MDKTKPRVCLACQNCRKRKVKCTGGPVCNECRRFNAKCVYREHYREKKNFSIKILQSPDFIKKDKNDSKNTAISSAAIHAAAQTQYPEQNFSNHHPSESRNQLAESSYPNQSFQFAYNRTPSNTVQNGFTSAPNNIYNRTSSFSGTAAPAAVSAAAPFPSSSPSTASLAAPTTKAPIAANSTSNETERQKREALGPASFLRKLNTFLESMEPMTRKPEYIFSQDALGLLHQLLKMPPPVVGKSGREISIQDRHLTEEQMLQCLADYYNSYHTMVPLLDPDTWIRKAKSVWRSMEYGGQQTSGSNQTDLAIVYMLIALGCAGCFTVSFQEVEDQEWSREYNRRAQLLVPNILQGPSISIIQYTILRAIYEVSQGEAEVGYMYTGIAVRNAMALDIHRLDPATSETPGAYSMHRTWLCVYILEKYWSFCVGRPSCIGNEFPMPKPYAPAFTNSTVYSTGIDHIVARVKFVHMCSELNKTWIDNDSPRDILSIFNLAEKASAQIDQTMAETSSEHLKINDLSLYEHKLTESQCKEWYWLRLYYWYNRMTFYRPFFILSIYLDIPNLSDYGDISKEVLEALDKGSKYCLEAALSIPPIVIAIDNRVERCQINWFTSSYLEASASILLLFAVCQQQPEKKVTECVTVFNQICHYLNNGLAGTGTILDHDRESVVQQMIENKYIRQALAKTRCNFVKVFFMSRMPDLNQEPRFKNTGKKFNSIPVNADVAGGYQPVGKIDRSELDLYWARALDLVGFQG